MKNYIKLLIILGLLTGTANASFKEHYDLGQEYFSNYQYSGAISEFKSALRINYMDTSARIGLVNAYIARATYLANNQHDYQKAADDYRSALFYMEYYPLKNTSGQYIPQIMSNLNACLKYIKFDTSAKNRYETAKKLRAEGNFAAAAYEFNQSLADTSLQKSCFEQIGDIMKLLGNNPKATEYYRKAVAVGPADLGLRMSYAQMLDNQGQENIAINEYNYILSKINSEDKQLLYTLEKIFKKKLDLHSNNADFNGNLAVILQKQGRLDDALVYYKQAEYYNPSDTNTRINVGTLYQEKGDHKTAIKAYESVLIVEPENIKALLYRAKAKLALGEDKEALEGFRKVLSLDPSNTEAHVQIFTAMKNTMTPAQFTEYIKKNMPDFNPSEVFYNYALDLHKQNKLDDAISMYNNAIKANPNNSEIYVNLAIAQNQAGNTETALETLKQANSKFPDNSQIKSVTESVKADYINTKLDRAAKLYDNKRFKEAIEEYSTIIPETVDSCLGIASSYQGLENNKKAIEYYKKALQLKPTDSEIAYYIAVLYSEAEDLANAKAYLNKSLVINKNNQQALELMKALVEQENIEKLNKAIAFFEASNFDKALPILLEVIKSDDKNSYAYYYLGMIYDEQTKRTEAIINFKKAYELNKEFEIVNYLIAIDYDAMEKYKDANEYYSKFIANYQTDDEYSQYAKTRIEELKSYVK